MDKKLRIAINGFGRIGRLFFRLAFNDSDFEIIALNDLGNLENMAYLLEKDTVYGKYNNQVSFEKSEEKVGKITSTGKLIVNSQKILFFQEKDPSNLPWKDLDIDLVIESTGVFESYEKSQAHLLAGAKRVLLSAPSKDDDNDLGKTVLMGINEIDLKSCKITSNGSCTTNSAHPVIQILNEKIGIKKAILSTVHAYTATQNLTDSPVKGSDLRRGRAAAYNIVPSTTGAALTVGKVIKDLKEKFDGISFRVPVICGSIADITMVTSKPTTVEEVNEILEKAANEPRWNKIMKVTKEQLVSSDIIGEEFGAIIDLNFTKVVDGDLVKVLSWYDNELGYARTLVEHARAIKAQL
jgi:glyceraldehyde 3-phosphate dehydrogenase